MARAMVTMVGSPSGMAATASVTAASTASARGYPRRRPMTSRRIDTATMAAAIHFPMTPSCRVRGVSRSEASVSIREIRPSSVSWPVATTTPLAVPYVTRVPLYAMPRRSPIPACRSTASALFSTGTDSPVRAASSTFSVRTPARRRSAGTLSPECSSTTSPGTSSAEESC